MPKYSVPFSPGTNVADADAAVGEVRTPRTFYSVAPPRKTGTMPTVALAPALNAYPAGYHAGAANLTAIEADLIKENILAGKTIFGVGGIVVAKLEIAVPAVLDSEHAEAIVTVDRMINRNAPFTSEHEQAYLDAPADYIKRQVPVLASTHAEAIVIVNQSYNKNAPVVRQYDLQMVVQGAFRSPSGVDADETAAAQNVTVNDMSLPPQTPGVDDAYKFGHPKTFDVLRINVGTAGIYVATANWEYWNGAWVALAGVTDGTNGFRNAGWNEVAFTRPGDWAVQNLGALGNQYYIRIRLNPYTSRVTQPLGTQAYVRIIT